MRQILLLLKRTVFLPKGSPGICSVREIKADVRHYQVAAEGGRVFCNGEADLLVEYLSFAEGKQYPGYEGYEQQLNNGGSMWQALLTVPFELSAEGDMPCPPLAEISVGGIQWFMVSPHALEMEVELVLSWQDEEIPAPQAAPADGWQQITLADIAQQNAHTPSHRHKLNTTESKSKEECLLMEQEDKIMRLGISDQGWQITTQEQEKQCLPKQEASILAAAIEEISPPESKQAAAEEIVAEEIAAEEIAAEEVIVEEIAIEKVTVEEIILKEPAKEEITAEEVILVEIAKEEAAAEEIPSPQINIQAVETPWQPPSQPDIVVEEPTAPMETERPRKHCRAAGMPRLQVRQQQMRRTTFMVSFSMEEK